MSWVTLAVLLVLGSYSWTPAGGQTCSLSAAQFLLSYTVTASAESVDGPTPAARVTWSTTVPPECVASVRVEFRTGSQSGPVVATYTTTNASQTEIIQTDLQCTTNYYITVVVTGQLSDGSRLTQSSRQVVVGDIPIPFGVRAEVTADNTSIRVSWQWYRQGLLMCVDLVRVHYQPEGGSLMRYTVDNTTATSATLSNLQCNTEYTIWVYARSGQSTSTTSVSRMIYLPARAPPTPTGVTAQFTNASSVRVAWRWTSSGPAPNCFNTTTVTYRPEGDGESSLQLRDPAANETTLTGLWNNTYYTVTVVATAGGHRRESVARRVHVLLSLQDIPAPVGVRAEATADNTSIRVSWQWSSTNASLYVDLVRVHYQPEGGSLMRYTVDNTTATSATLLNLQCDTEYTIWVYARGGLNNRTSVPRMISLPARAPPTPTGVTAQFTNASSVRVTWHWTSSGPAPSCFNTTTVTYRPEGGGKSSLQLSDPAATEATLTGLQCNTNYTITVVATVGAHRRESVARTVLSLQDIPAPVGVRAEVTADNTSIRVSWQWSRQGVIACVDLVRVHYHPDGGSLMRYTVGNTTSATSATLSNLQCNTEYAIWVYARGGPTSKTSIPRMVSLPARAPPTPTGVTAQLTNASSVRVAWQWTSSGPAPDCFNTTTVTYHPEGGGESSLQLSDPAATEATLTGLQCNTNYTITVVATAGEHRREGNVFLRLQVPLGAPQSLEATFVQSTEVYLSWREVPCVQNGYIVRYFATCGSERNVQRSKSVVTTGSTVDDLTPNTEYTFQAAAIGTGPFTEPITLGGAPRLVTGTPVNSTTVVLSWSEVYCFNRSGAITHYLVQYQSSCCGGTVENVTTDGLVQVVSGLTPNTVYTFRVAAVGASQKIGPFSNPVNTSLPDTPPIASTQSTSAWAAVAVIAVVALLVLLVASAVIWYQQRSIAKMKRQTQSVYYSAVASQPSEQAKTAEISLKECSAYGQVDRDGAEREEPHIYELP